MQKFGTFYEGLCLSLTTAFISRNKRKITERKITFARFG